MPLWRKLHLKTIDSLDVNAMPDDFLLQVQTGLLVTERAWLDFVSYSGGLPMAVIRVVPDPAIHEAIITAAAATEKQISEKLSAYKTASIGLYPTERRIEQEMMV